MMKVKYIGPNMGATGPQSGGVYEVSAVYEKQGRYSLQVVDEDQSDWNFDDDPNWKPGYLYSPSQPTLGGGPGVTYSGGKFFIVEDENGQLAKAGVPPLSE